MGLVGLPTFPRIEDIVDMHCMLTRSGATISDFERGFPSEIY
jgi:hypothetical protein